MIDGRVLGVYICVSLDVIKRLNRSLNNIILPTKHKISILRYEPAIDYSLVPDVGC